MELKEAVTQPRIEVQDKLAKSQSDLEQCQKQLPPEGLVWVTREELKEYEGLSEGIERLELINKGHDIYESSKLKELEKANKDIQVLTEALKEAVTELESFELMVMEDEGYADKIVKLKAIANKQLKGGDV